MNPVLPINTATNLQASLNKNGSDKNVDEASLRKASRALESSFIAEMLKSAGVGKSRETYGGGAGEDGFASFLVSAQADMIVESGGFGLAEQIFQSLTQRQNND